MRRRPQEEHANHERWAIPYADLMTLLLAFFVVMYALSAVNEGKYRLLSESMQEAFNGSARVIRTSQPGHAVQPMPTPGAKVHRETRNPAHIALPVPARAATPPGTQPPAEHDTQRSATLERIADNVQRAMQPLIDRHLVNLRRNRFWIEIDIRTDLLFPSGVADLQPSARHILQRLAGTLSGFSNPVRIEGYTDDKPINTRLYPSNWELSAARAACVARLFADDGVDPSRLGIVGWGQYRPVASNATADGRNRNRRVTVTVLSDRGVPARFYSDARRLPATGGGAQAGGVGAASGASP